MRAVCGTAPPTSIAAPLAASWQSALCTCGFWPKPPCRRCALSGPRPVWAHLPSELDYAPVGNRSMCRQSPCVKRTARHLRRAGSGGHGVRVAEYADRRPRTRRRAGAARRLGRRSVLSAGPAVLVRPAGMLRAPCGAQPDKLQSTCCPSRGGSGSVSPSCSCGGHGSRGHLVAVGQGCCGVTSPVS